MKNQFLENIRVNKNLKVTRNIYPIQIKLDPHRKVVITSEQISRSTQEMARKIAEDYMDKPLGLVCVEYGGREFYNLLIDNLNSLGVNNFFQGAVKMERGATKISNDRLEPKFHFETGILCDKNKLKNIHLLIVDDQISSGATFDFLIKRYSDALSVELATLIVKSRAQKRLDDIKYYSYFIKSGKDRCVGFGMDYREKYRKLRYVTNVKKEDMIR